MLTEVWDLDYEFERPPKWVSGRKQRPLIVHLDQWCWSTLAKDRAGLLAGTPDEGSYEFFKQLALDEVVVFPLSQAHYRENWVRLNADARWDTAVVMAELSGFATISPIPLAEWEPLVTLALYFGFDDQIPEPEVFGWGHRHCMTGTEQAYVMADRTTGARVDLSTYPPSQRESLLQLEESASYRIELALLALNEPRLAQHGMPLTPIAGFGEERFAASQREIREAIDQHGRTSDVVRKVVGFMGFKDSLPSLYRAANAVGVDWDSAMSELALLPPSERVDAMWELLSLMPVQGTFAALQLRAHLKPDFNWQKSDCMDLFTVAHVLPFTDFVVVDKAMHELCTQARIASDAVLVRRLGDLRVALEGALS